MASVLCSCDVIIEKLYAYIDELPARMRKDLEYAHETFSVAVLDVQELCYQGNTSYHLWVDDLTAIREKFVEEFPDVKQCIRQSVIREAFSRQSVY